MRPLGNIWGHGAGTWGGFRGQVGTWGWDMGWFRGQVGTTQSGPFYSPHHCVGFLFFAWIPPLLLLRPSAAPRSQFITAPLLTPHLSQHNSSTSITSLITAQLITAPLLTPHLSHLHFSHHLSHHHSSQLHFSHLTSHTHPHLSHHLSHHHSSQLHFSHLTHHIITAQLITAPWSADCHRLPFSWQVQCDCLSCGRRSTQSCQAELRRAWSPLGRGCGARGRRWAAAASRVAGAAHRAFGRSCGAATTRGRRSTQSCPAELRRAWSPLGHGCLSRGRRSTQSCPAELRRAWSPLGRGCLARGRRCTPELRRVWSPLGRGCLGGAAARVVAVDPGNYFSNPGNYFLNPRNCFLNPRNYISSILETISEIPELFLNPGPKPRNHLQNQIAFTNPNHWARIAVNHLKSRDCTRQVSHVLTKREGLPGCWRRHSSFCFVLSSLTPHLRISHCFFLTCLYSST